MFAVYLADDRRRSFAHFGGYDQKIVEESLKEQRDKGIDTSGSSNGIYWVDITSDIHWQVRLRAASIGNTSIQVSVMKLIFDTGSSLSYMPEQDYRDFMAELRRHTDCYYNSDE